MSLKINDHQQTINFETTSNILNADPLNLLNSQFISVRIVVQKCLDKIYLLGRPHACCIPSLIIFQKVPIVERYKLIEITNGDKNVVILLNI